MAASVLSATDVLTTQAATSTTSTQTIPPIRSPQVKILVSPEPILSTTNGIIAVTILSNKTSGFSPFAIDSASVTFGSGAEATPIGTPFMADVNHAGMKDSALFFRGKDTGLKQGDLKATLTGAILGQCEEKNTSYHCDVRAPPTIITGTALVLVL